MILKFVSSSSHSTVLASIVDLARSSEIRRVFTLECTSTGSPATEVTWMKDGIALSSSSSVYQVNQVLVDRRAATYKSILTVQTGPYGITGNYQCNVSNLIGSASENITVQGGCYKLAASWVWYNSIYIISLQVCKSQPVLLTLSLVNLHRSFAPLI